MRWGVLGTGMVELAISNRLAELGHEVTIGTRDPSKSEEKLKSLREAVQVGIFTEAAAFGEILFNATGGAVSIEALKMAGESNLNGRVLADISNPLDFSKGMPSSLFVSNTDSLGDLSAARAMEMYLPIWLRLWGALGSGMFNIRIAC